MMLQGAWALLLMVMLQVDALGYWALPSTVMLQDDAPGYPGTVAHGIALG